MISNYENELSKFSCYKSFEGKARPSSILLFREYQSRLMSWKRRLNDEELWFIPGRKFNNLFIDLNLNEVDGFVHEKMVIEDLEKMGVKDVMLSIRLYEGFFMSMAINWELFKFRAEIQSHADLLPPYEPICKLLLRDGSIFYAENTFVIDSFMTYLRSKSPIVLPSMEDEFLNYIDEHCSDVPNQLKINGLWDGFNLSRIRL
ncbi:hypothetical protein [Pedobacter gandavensis]|uniref:Uncharacterized protein n=1 Tax=Pedobacter gandavensis TaxID=2679963 RepID=A0ABR6EZ21_9SPHI|nr:hypothetical protein [Pedobacter gandavensis]MBB2150530.1 hypothetical protein [Pedobacter gandavensis]